MYTKACQKVTANQGTYMTRLESKLESLFILYIFQWLYPLISFLPSWWESLHDPMIQKAIVAYLTEGSPLLSRSTERRHEKRHSGPSGGGFDVGPATYQIKKVLLIH